MWVFNERHDFGVETDPTQGEFFVNNEIDRSSALVRETVQNSLDARRDDAGPVAVQFRFHEGALFLDQARARSYVDGLLPHLRASGLDPETMDLDHPRFLTVEDFGTHGLRGPTESKAPGDFYYFWHVVGRSGKGDQKAGRWGLGKTVFPNSSRLSAFFGYTVRSDDGRRLLFGQTCLRTHELGGKTYLPYAFYQSCGPRQFELPIDAPDRVAEFRRDYCLTREAEPGLSIVVPYPHSDLTEPDLILAALEHYFFPIVAGQLMIRVNDQVLDAATIQTVAQRVQPRRKVDLVRAVAFAAEIQGLPREAVHAVDVPDRLAAGGPHFAPDAFSPEHLARMRDEFRRNQLLAVRIPVLIEPVDGPAQRSAVTIYLKRDELLFAGHDFYLRGGITLSGQSVFGARRALGILHADDPPVCRFLGDAENPAHTLWNPRSPRLAARYRRSHDTVRFLREVMVGLLDALMQASVENDPYALSEVFFTPRRADRRERDRQSEPQPAPVLAAAGPPRFVLQPVRGGFRLRAGPGLSADALPVSITLLAAYEIRQGNPFKKYVPHDFRLDRDPVAVHSSGVSSLRCLANRLELTVVSPEFELDVSGFDTHRDVKVRVEERSDSP